MEGVLYIRLETSGVVWQGPCEVFHVLATVSTSAKGVTLYDNSVAVATRQVQRIQTYSQETKDVVFPLGRYFAQGVYAALDTECTECVIGVRPLPHC